MGDALTGRRFSQITPDDHAGSVWIASILCLIYSVLTLALRGHLRLRIYGMDDYIALAATLIQVGEVIAVMIGLNHGLGKTQLLLRPSEVTKASRATFTAQILFILSAAAAKASTLCLMMRLFNLSGPRTGQKLRQRVFYWIALAVMAGVSLWAILSIVALAVNCSVPGSIRGNAGSCAHQFLRWQLITAFDVVTEGVLILIVICVVWPVHLSFAMKCQVVLAFSFRLLVAVLSILHLHYIAEYTGSDNPGIAIVPVVAIQQVQLCWSLISATIPNLKSFVKSFSSGFGIQLDPSLTQAYGSGRRTNSGYEMGSVNGSGTAKPRSGGRSHSDNEETPPVPTKNKLATTREHDSIDSGGSQGSQDHIIRKDVQWNIHYETEPGRAL
ncbi:hypothetical protein A1O7_04023 [Cladophialophora yegresii CBS 114405]|uniref:Rhodopsin domain-containing protein n=1 Tax=Cladophialophora yegresii CBS 114405 TaxID=1182544 RepID=W9W5T1_9EURO|nr:uncharacterized protein A1O7_04023 [Cladophialophora yegresii CBS 114405]EXJ59876.1 hypothetical protein A1O7_04023 [Cladophialophora yegresii CBS 114405]